MKYEQVHELAIRVNHDFRDLINCKDELTPLFDIAPIVLAKGRLETWGSRVDRKKLIWHPDDSLNSICEELTLLQHLNPTNETQPTVFARTKKVYDAINQQMDQEIETYSYENRETFKNTRSELEFDHPNDPRLPLTLLEYLKTPLDSTLQTVYALGI